MRWLNAHARKHPDGGLAYSLDPYRYIEYRFGYKYYDDKYYDKNRQNHWNNKYDLANFNIDYGVTQSPVGSPAKLPKL